MATASYGSGVPIVLPALRESCGIVTQRKPALVVLVHMKHSVLDARNWRRSPAAPTRTVVLGVRACRARVVAFSAAPTPPPCTASSGPWAIPERPRRPKLLPAPGSATAAAGPRQVGGEAFTPQILKVRCSNPENYSMAGSIRLVRFDCWFDSIVAPTLVSRCVLCVCLCY